MKSDLKASSLSTKGRIGFDRNEVAGAFGDMGTDLPLILAMVAINHLDIASTMIMFGLFHVLTGLRYKLPMPVQPLKAMAAIMITTGLDKSLLYGAGLLIGIIMLVLSLSGILSRLYSSIPKSVVRGIQFGLGLNLMMIAMGFMQREAPIGYVISGLGVVVTLALYGNRRIPAAIILLLIGVVFAFFKGLDVGSIVSGVGLSLPLFNVPSLEGMLKGGLQLALPQLPLSLANSVIATSLLVRDFFPERNDVNVKKIGVTYGIMNIVSPFFSGIPVCHGAGGMAGHYRFGARTGGSVIIYGCIYLILGLAFASVVEEVTRLFPFPILGVLLFFEGFALLQLVRDVQQQTGEFYIAILVGAIIIGLPYGYLIGLVAGAILYRLTRTGKLKLSQI